jgi:hypothetical protein
MLVPLEEEPQYSDEYYQLYMEVYYGGSAGLNNSTSEGEEEETSGAE